MPVNLAQPSRFNVVQHLRPRALGIANNDRIEVLGCVTGTERRMIAAGHHDLAAGFEFGRNLVGPRRKRRHERYADNVYFRIEIESFDILVDNSHCVFGRCQRGDDRQRKHAEPQHRALGNIGVVVRHAHPFAGRKNKQYFHIVWIPTRVACQRQYLPQQRCGSIG